MEKLSVLPWLTILRVNSSLVFPVYVICKIMCDLTHGCTVLLGLYHSGLVHWPSMKQRDERWKMKEMKIFLLSFCSLFSTIDKPLQLPADTGINRNMQKEALRSSSQLLFLLFYHGSSLLPLFIWCFKYIRQRSQIHSMNPQFKLIPTC